ncbi:phospholipid carrier-dependent glycosyltransferase [Actinoplanes derwentensis]|uniref:Dolichyl-phosphate-mannose-protein mannosyltransferase n=1 Tax=Actinoplanes derwentensis TaxID=113562 RepID=A0A1H2D7L8_9ACTN|nr:phospholipid carrier-dependent glycosyltransferase [Actinoplanes derwentensis]GID85599.1 glycosyl transferase [Actinoplanes derwentensis]SDT78246.1 Dolichyl-phosphate-mannose-protein mannosyltransferase [Actinoplanes derwentensis]
MLRRRLIYILAVVAMLGQMAFAMVTTAMQQSPTIDEPVYVATAEVYRQQQSLRYNPEHPPLGKLIIAAGTAFAGAELDPAYPGNQTRLGRHLLYETGNNPFQVMLLARLPVIVLTLVFGLVVLFFARDLAGAWAGLIALALYSFSPDLIAHGSLATLDVPAAGMLLTAFWLAWRARERPKLYVPLAAVALGAALATRMSVLPAVPLLILLLALSTWKARPGVLKKRLAEAAGAALGAGLIAIAVVWFTYLVVDPRLRWETPPGLPELTGLKAMVVDLLPFPQAYRDGMLVQFKFENKLYNGFLLGEAYKGSPWYYMPVAILIKTPLGMLALWVAGVFTMLVVPKLRAATLYLLPVSALLLLFTMVGARNFGTRYVIILPMFLAVAAGAVALIRTIPSRVATVGLLLMVAVSSLRTFPYYLPYSNEAFGGTANTHNNLHDANVDWGQDLARLGQHLRTKYPGEPVWLIYKGSGVPRYYGIDARDPYSVPVSQIRGLLVISDSRVALASPRLKQMMEGSTLIDQVGYSISIYRR